MGTIQISNESIIDGKKNQYRFLSDSYETSVTYRGVSYRNNVAAYQAQKILSEKKRLLFSLLNSSAAFKMGHELEDIRDDWNNIKKDEMYNVCLAKFMQHPKLQFKLISTYPNKLYFESKKNDVGKILMDIRKALINLYTRNGKISNIN